MSFDFASDYKNSRHSGPGAGRPRMPAASPPAFAAPHRPTTEELVLLVGELFREGSLSWDQLWSLACLPDLAPRLSAILDAAPETRKPLAAE